MVAPGQIAIIHYTSQLVDGPDAGEVVDTTDVDVALEKGIYHEYRDYRPLEFRVGEGKLLEGLDEAVQEMDQGEKRTVTVPPEDAYGECSIGRIVTVSRADLEERSSGDVTVAEDELVRSTNGAVGWIVNVDGEDVTVDFNHELAGRTIEFGVKILEVHGGRIHGREADNTRFAE